MDTIFSQLKESFTNVSEWLRGEYLQISTGRATPALLDSVQFEAYGAMQPIKNAASISLEDARTLRISPWDKAQIKDIERAIIDAKLPFTLAVDDAGLRLAVPQMTEESKKEIVKLVKAKLEEARVRVRNEREKAIKEIDAQDAGDDEKHTAKDSVQKAVDAANEDLQSIFTEKEADIMSV